MVGFRQILLILGAIFLLRLIGKVMTARREIKAQKVNEQHSRAKAKAEENIGKTTISQVNKDRIKESDYTSFEEVK